MLFLFHVLLRPSSGQVLRDSLCELVESWTHVCGGMVGVVMCQLICFFANFFVEGVGGCKDDGVEARLSAVVFLSQDE